MNKFLSRIQTSMATIVEENRALRIRMSELQKMVDAMIVDKRRLSTRVEELLTPAPAPEPVCNLTQVS